MLKSYCQNTFKKIRINGKKRSKPLNVKILALIDERNKIVQSVSDQKNTKKLKEIEERISDTEAAENYEVIMKNFKRFGDNPESINLQEIWKLLKSIGPKHNNILPIAKRNHKGVLVSCPKGIKKLLAKEYKQRLRNRPIRPDLKNLRKRRKRIFKMQLKIAEETTSTPWKMNDLENALKCLKNNKARDHAGYINEIFKTGVIGSDLKNTLLIIFNSFSSK